MSHVFKASLLLTIFFGVNKVVALLRQGIIGRQFGLSPDIDAFNISNNLPDLVFSLFSGGALALAFIPVFAEYLTGYGREASWKLFSKTANFVFLITLVLALFFALFADPFVRSEFGVAPGFSASQQDLVIDLMRIHLVAMLVFSLSGLAMASLQAHKHFLLPAVAPILYNIGQIIGAIILAPTQSMSLGPFSLPAFGLGVYGLAFGVVLGALLHLGIQVPGMLTFRFRWTASLDFTDTGVQKILHLMLPRIATVFLIQIMFLSRDNLASRLGEGTVSALTYGYFIMQVPETLIGTAIATALLPTLSEFVTRKKQREFETILTTSMRVVIAISLIVTVVLILTLPEFVREIFHLDPSKTNLLTLTTYAFLFGLTAHSLLEVVVRAFYAKQNAKTPFLTTLIRTGVFLLLSVLFFTSFGAVGLALIDSLAVLVEVSLLLFFLRRVYPGLFSFSDTIVRTVGACLTSIVFISGVFHVLSLSPLIEACLGLVIGGILALLFISKELKMIVKI